MEDSVRQADDKVASGIAREHVWPHVKFVTCEEDKDIESPMAVIALQNILTHSKDYFWETNKDLFVKCIQLKRGTCSHAMKEAFIGMYDALNFWLLCWHFC